MGQTLIIEVHVPAPPERVYECWTTADGLARWWWPHLADTYYEVEDRVGGRYRIESVSAGIGVEGEFPALDPPRLITMTWRFLHEGVSEVEETVSVALEGDDAGTDVTVTHHLDDLAGAGDDIRQGWQDVLARLQRLR